MVILSIPGLFRTVLIIIGAILLMRLVGRLMIAKRNVEAHENSQRNQRQSDTIREQAKQNYGRTTISKLGKKKFRADDFVDFEEIEEDQ